MVNLGFIPPAVAGIAGLLLIASFIIKPLKGIRVAVTGWGGKYATLIAIALVVVLLAFAGGSAWLGDKWAGIAGGGAILGTGSVGEVSASSAITDLNCRFNAPSKAAVYQEGSTFRADPADLSHYYIDNLFTNGTVSYNGTLICTRTGDIDKAARVTIYAKADDFRSDTSTTDANVYSILATSNVASRIPGVVWARTIYLNDGAVATTASDREMTEVVFVGGASAQAVETVGYYFTMPGAAIYGYIANQSQKDINFYAKINGADKEIAKLTITHTAA